MGRRYGATALAATRWQQAEQAAERWLMATKNTGEVFIAGMSRPRIPDFISQEGGRLGRGYLAEVKWVSQLDARKQLRDFLVYANEQQQDLYVLIRENTQVPQEVAAWAASNGVTIVRVFQ